MQLLKTHKGLTGYFAVFGGLTQPRYLLALANTPSICEFHVISTQIHSRDTTLFQWKIHGLLF